MIVTQSMERLLAFAIAHGLLEDADILFARNQLLYAMGIDAPHEQGDEDTSPLPPTATPMLSTLAEDAVARGIIEDSAFPREQFCAHLMNLLTPPPSFIQSYYQTLFAQNGAQAATDWFFALCRANDYIRVDEIAKNIEFTAPSPYGELEITINLSKPEKDPRDIAKLKHVKASGYPACMICLENEGYAGRPDYSPHTTLRTVPLTLQDEAWRLQFSPYSYYPEHCIALNERHIPMSISRRTFTLLLDFVDQYPHYFMGSNADLPIVGGSILNHDHFQGGCHVFPMDKAEPYCTLHHPSYPGVTIQPLRWPMTCVRLTAKDVAPLTDLADTLLIAWRAYDDPSQAVLHETNGEPHNTITPIARKCADGTYVLQLVLRNNRTTKEHPMGIFHPHADLHHIKKENIGLIEVMGLFILPGRLRDELSGLEAFLTGSRPLLPPAEDDPLAKHSDWVASLSASNGTPLDQAAARAVLTAGLAQKCSRVLEDAGVFKDDMALLRFLASVGIRTDA